MNTLIRGLTMSLGILAGAAQAEQMLTVDGADFPLSELMGTCQSIANDPAAQIACFSELSRLLEEQSDNQQEVILPVPEALEALRTLAQYQDDDSGLSIVGSDCNIQIVYFNNYFHISRRNISTIDLFSVQFDASKVQYDQITGVEGAQAPLSRGLLDAGATAQMRGGVVLDSSELNFAPRSPRMSLDAYAGEVISQLPAREDQAFEFVLIHPQHGDTSAEIWGAFEDFVKSCKA